MLRPCAASCLSPNCHLLNNPITQSPNCQLPYALPLRSIVASYPFLPATGAIAASAAKLHHQQQRHKQLQQQQLLGAQDQQAPDAEPKAAAAAAESGDAEGCCFGSGNAQDVLHSREQQSLQQRRQLLDSQLQQWWGQLQALGLADF